MTTPTIAETQSSPPALGIEISGKRSLSVDEWLAANPGPLAIELSSATKSVRLTSAAGGVLTVAGVDAAKALFAKAAVTDRKLWASDAAMQEKIHREFFAALGCPRIWCARTVDRALAPQKDKSELLSGRALAALMLAHNAAPRIERQHAHWIEDEDRMWRAVARRGYLIDEQLMRIERQARHRELADFTRNFGIDIRRADATKEAWLTSIGVKFERGDDYGYTWPSACDTTDMPPEHTETWAAYKATHSTLKRVQLLDGVSKKVEDDGRVRPIIKTNSAASGRMAVASPGMQGHPAELRGVFLAEPGHDIIAFDHSNAELRVLARLIGDPAFTKRVMDGDPYSELAEFTGRSRSDEKWRLIAWAYGLGITTLTKTVGEEQAANTFRGCRELFPEIEAWSREQTTRAVRGERLTTLTGRPLPSLGEKASRPGLATNLLTQGSARDAWGAGVRRAAALLGESALYFPLHDELFVLSPRGKAEETSEVLRQAMTVDLGDGVVLTGTAKVHRGRWGK
ncbi:DNA polymerase [Lacisediminihabitans sp. FW035]